MISPSVSVPEGLADAGVYDLDSVQTAAELRQTDQLIRWAFARRMALGAHLADTLAVAEETLDPTMERSLHYGADGTPAVSEFVACEVSGLLEIGWESATSWLGQVLNVRHRHPRMWQAVLAGLMPAHLACQVSGQVALAGLDADQARWFDARFADRMDRRGWRRSEQFAAGLIVQCDPVKAETRRQQHLAQRSVRFHDRADEPGVRWVEGRLDTADAVRLDAAISRIAEILADHENGDGQTGDGQTGDGQTGADGETAGGAEVAGRGESWAAAQAREVRRAQALGILASPARALALLQGAAPADTEQVPFLGNQPVLISDPDINTRKATLVIHISDQFLTTTCPGRPGSAASAAGAAGATAGGSQVARVEQFGAATREQVRELLAGCQVTVKPMIDLNEVPAADRYEIPDNVRELLRVRHLYDNTPHSNQLASSTDGDHVRPFTCSGPPGQTGPENLTPTARRWHRWKTIGRLRTKLIEPSLLVGPGVQRWRTPLGFEYETSPHGTRYLGHQRQLPEGQEWVEAWDVADDLDTLPNPGPPPSDSSTDTDVDDGRPGTPLPWNDPELTAQLDRLSRPA